MSATAAGDPPKHAAFRPADLTPALTRRAGMVIGFYSGWRLTLVMLGCVPLLAATGGFSTKLMATRNAKEAKMYSQASAISHETFSAMRTVAAFNGEERAKRTYTQAIADCMRLGIQQKTISGVGLGLSAPSGPSAAPQRGPPP